MKEFLELNQLLNYSFRNKQESALGQFSVGMTKHCLNRHPDKMKELVDQLEILTDTSILKSKDSYEGVSTTAIGLINVINPYVANMEQTVMRK